MGNCLSGDSGKYDVSEVEALKKQLADKDQEITTLKQKAGAAAGTTPPASYAAAAGKGTAAASGGGQEAAALKQQVRSLHKGLQATSCGGWVTVWRARVLIFGGGGGCMGRRVGAGVSGEARSNWRMQIVWQPPQVLVWNVARPSIYASATAYDGVDSCLFSLHNGVCVHACMRRTAFAATRCSHAWQSAEVACLGKPRTTACPMCVFL